MTIDTENSIYVGNLPYDVSDEILGRIFDIYGAILSVKIQNDHSSGFRYGFVSFVNPRSAVLAIREMNGQKIYGRVARVELRNNGRPDLSRQCPRRDFSCGLQRQRDVQRERFQDYGRGSENGHYRQYVDLDQSEGDHGHRSDVEHGNFRKRERDCERASSFNSMEPRNSGRKKTVDKNNQYQTKDHRYVDGRESDNGPKGDSKKGRVPKRGRDWERESSLRSEEPRNSDRQKKGPDGDVDQGRVSKPGRHRERKSSLKSGEQRNIDCQKSLDRNNHHQKTDHRYVVGAQCEKGPYADLEQGRGRHREQESRSTSVETSNSSPQKIVGKNSHHQIKDNRSADGNQFDNGPGGDVEPRRARKRERDSESSSSFSSEESRDNSRQKSVDTDNQSVNRSLSYDRSRGNSVESLNDDQDQIETKLASSDQKIVKLHEEISHMKDNGADKEEEISQLQEKYQKLDDSSKAATKLTSDRHVQLEKLFKCYLHVKDCEQKLKQAEEELQLLVDATMTEFEMEGVLLS